MGDLVVLGGLVGEPCESPLGGEFIRDLKMKGGKGIFIKKTPLFTVGQTLTLALFWASI